MQECIQKTINKETQKIKFIYEGFLSKPNTDGYILFRFLLLPSGKVDSVAIDSTTIMNSEFKEVLKNNLKQWEFDPACVDTILKIKFPMIFEDRKK